MCSLVRADPSASGCGRCEIRPSGETRRDSFSTPLRPPCKTPFWPLLMSPARRCSKTRSTPRFIGAARSPWNAPREHVLEHHEIGGQAVEGMLEGGGPVLFEEEMSDPRKAVTQEG